MLLVAEIVAAEEEILAAHGKAHAAVERFHLRVAPGDKARDRQYRRYKPLSDIFVIQKLLETKIHLG